MMRITKDTLKEGISQFSGFIEEAVENLATKIQDLFQALIGLIQKNSGQEAEYTLCSQEGSLSDALGMLNSYVETCIDSSFEDVKNSVGLDWLEQFIKENKEKLGNASLQEKTALGRTLDYMAMAIRQLPTDIKEGKTESPYNKALDRFKAQADILDSLGISVNTVVYNPQDKRSETK